jgi:N-acetylglutamate synthase-like GNAT family acetyltransferase
MNYKIRICTKEDVPVLARTIRESFQDVARRFGLTQESAPSHPSHCTVEWIERDMARGVAYWVIENENGVAGCVAMEKANPKTCYLERLAVLPEQRRQGLGNALVAHVLSQAAHSGAQSVNIGIIAGHTELKNWYSHIGFVEGESREFPRLPFRVTFMSYRTDNQSQ